MINGPAIRRCLKPCPWTELDGETFFDAEFVIGHGNTLPPSSGLAFRIQGRRMSSSRLRYMLKIKFIL